MSEAEYEGSLALTAGKLASHDAQFQPFVSQPAAGLSTNVCGTRLRAPEKPVFAKRLIDDFGIPFWDAPDRLPVPLPSEQPRRRIVRGHREAAQGTVSLMTVLSRPRARNRGGGSLLFRYEFLLGSAAHLSVANELNW